MAMMHMEEVAHIKMGLFRGTVNYKAQHEVSTPFRVPCRAMPTSVLFPQTTRSHTPRHDPCHPASSVNDQIAQLA